MTYTAFTSNAETFSLIVMHNASSRCIGLNEDWTLETLIDSCSGGWRHDSDVANEICQFDTYEELVTDYPELLL
jgi:hypothetical protein